MTATDSLKAFLSLGFSLAKVLADLSDGFQFSDLGDIVGAAKAIPGGIAAAPSALQQYLDMSDEDASPLESWALSAFPHLTNESVEAGIKAALTGVIELHSLARLIVPKSVVA